MFILFKIKEHQGENIVTLLELFRIWRPLLKPIASELSMSVAIYWPIEMKFTLNTGLESISSKIQPTLMHSYSHTHLQSHSHMEYERNCCWPLDDLFIIPNDGFGWAAKFALSDTQIVAFHVLFARCKLYATWNLKFELVLLLLLLLFL